MKELQIMIDHLYEESATLDGVNNVVNENLHKIGEKYKALTEHTSALHSV